MLIAPFFSEEFFWIESEGIGENRLEAGLKIPYHQRAELSLSYLCLTKREKKGKRKSSNILCVDLSFSF